MNCLRKASQVIGSVRSIHTSSALNGKRNFRKFLLYNKRGTREFKQRQRIAPDPDIPINKRGVRDTGYTYNGKYMEVPEMIPEIIVPNLEEFNLKPYVSYKTREVYQPEFTSEDLFNAIYAKKILDDYKAGKLNSDGSPIEPSENEKISEKEAFIRARKTGSDIF